jgi:hypothetical protein
MVLIHQSNEMIELEEFIRTLIRDPTILENFEFFLFFIFICPQVKENSN